jgi:hypothetical protein
LIDPPNREGPEIAMPALARSLAVLGGIVLLASLVRAEDASLAKPTAEPILIVSGEIARTNGHGVARFDREMLEAIGTTTIRTRTPWHDYVAEFEGVSMQALMEYVGAHGTEVTATALNDYQSTIPMSDFERFEVVLAMKRDGKEMPIRDKGPLFIVYPYDSAAELQSEQYYSRSVWQLKELEVR